MKLTDKQEVFCREYLIDLNATQAAIRAGYSQKTSATIGNENLTKPLIQSKIQSIMNARAEKVEINSAWVLGRLKEIDELDISDIMRDDLSAFKKLSEWPKIWRTSISGIDIMAISGGDDVEQIIKKIKWPDKVKNLEMIGRHVSVKAWDKEVEKSTETMADSIAKLIDKLPN